MLQGTAVVLSQKLKSCFYTVAQKGMFSAIMQISLHCRTRIQTAPWHVAYAALQNVQLAWHVAYADAAKAALPLKEEYPSRFDQLKAMQMGGCELENSS